MKSLPKESTFKKRVLSRLRKIPKVVVFTIQQTSIRGTPDLLLCVGGKFVALELKKSSNAPITELQIYNLEKINNSGGYGVICFPENFEEVISRIEGMIC